jgi:hypothetical protein
LLAQPLYPEYGLNRKLGWPQRLSACFEDERKLLPCLKFMDDSLVIHPTLHRERAFIPGLQAP